MAELPGFAEMATEAFDRLSPWRCGGCDAPKDSPKPGVPCPFECGSSWTYNIDGDTIAFRVTSQPAYEPAHTLRRHRRPVDSLAVGSVIGAVLGLVVCALMTLDVIPTPVLRPWWLSLVAGCVGALALVAGWLSLVFRGRKR